MPISPYVAGLREHVGNGLLMLPSAAGVVVDDTGRVLLGRRSDNGRWSLPAGAIDPGEQPAEAVVREVYEETGVHVAVERLVGVALRDVTVYPNGNLCQYLSVFFRCRPTGGHARVNDSESLEVAWCGLQDLPELDAFDRTRIDLALDDTAPAWYAQPGQSYDWLPVRDPAVAADFAPESPTKPLD
ncbi:MAG: NUDIX domain-containing protein [Actinocatenispora sp.]